jgi:hypothetical protein
MDEVGYNQHGTIKTKTAATNCGGIGDMVSGVDRTQLKFHNIDTHSLTHLAIFCKLISLFSGLVFSNLVDVVTVGVPDESKGTIYAR